MTWQKTSTSVSACLMGLTWRVQVQVQVHLFTLIQLQYNNKEKKEEVKNRANYTLN